jgi:hypothetical protein
VSIAFYQQHSPHATLKLTATHDTPTGHESATRPLKKQQNKVRNEPEANINQWEETQLHGK